MNVIVVITLVRGSEERLKVEEIAGLQFEVTYLSCDGIAEDEAIRVYAQVMVKSRAWFFSSWGNHRTLLLRYDPRSYGSPLPSITRQSPSTIVISVPEVSSIGEQNDRWAGNTIDYSIGKVDYPAWRK